MKAVEALRAELEEEEQALEGSHEGSVSEGAQADGPSSQAGSASPQQAAAVGHDDDAHSDQKDDASQPDVTCALTTCMQCVECPPCTPPKISCTVKLVCFRTDSAFRTVVLLLLHQHV